MGSGWGLGGGLSGCSVEAQWGPERGLSGGVSGVREPPP